MKKEMKLIFSDGKIHLALLVMLLCFNGYSIPIWIEIWDWDFAYRESALQLTIGGIFFGGIMLLMPFLASIPAAPLQVEEIIFKRRDRCRRRICGTGRFVEYHCETMRREHIRLSGH